MKIPLTKYGIPEVIIYPLVILAAMAAAYLLRGLVRPDWAYIAAEAVLVLGLIWCLSFFRDPDRKIPQGQNLLLSPADGRVSDVEKLKTVEGFDGPVMRIGIFLSIFNVHINRAPCDVKIDKTTYRPGKFKNALTAESAKVNESNDISMTRLNAPLDKLVVRQISGAIAKHIVCCVKAGDEFNGGDRFGMIKFGSRTELYIPLRDNLKILTKKGEKVKAGLTILAKYEDK